MENSSDRKQPTPLVPRDPRGSLEVFNPSAASASRPSNPVFRPQPPSWASSPDQGEIHDARKLSSKSGRTVTNADHQDITATDEETGKPRAVKVRTSGDEPNKAANSRRDSGDSVRSSGDMSDDGTGGGSTCKERGFPRVSEDLKDALSTFQQKFVVSDATKADHPIMYTSAGFFNMTGYTSKEVVGRNCRFLQGKDTEDVAKIREALEGGSTYCGRLLNYKKDGTPFSRLHP